MVNKLLALLEKLKAPPPIITAIKVLDTLIHDMKRCDLFKHASAMAYVTLLSLVPSLAAIFGFAKPFLGKDSFLFQKITAFILAHLATGSGEDLLNYLANFIEELNVTKLGVAGFVGIFVSLTLLLRQIEIALNRIFLVKKPRNVVLRIVYFLGFLFVGMMLAGAGFYVLYDRLLAVEQNISYQVSFIRQLVPYIGTWAVFTFLYKVVPNTNVAFRYAAAGAVPAMLLFQAASRSYGWYASNFTSYQAFYGALAAIPLFLMWLYIIWLITLFGAVIAWRLQQGFELSDDMDTENLALSPTEKLRNHQLQAMTPYIVLLTIMDRFRKGDGQGISGAQMAADLNIPAPWIEDAMEAMIDMNFIVSAADDEGTHFLDRKLFPAVPADQVKLSELKSGITQPSKAWLAEWEHSWPKDLRRAISQLWEKEDAAIPEMTLADFLQALPQQAPEKNDRS